MDAVVDEMSPEEEAALAALEMSSSHQRPQLNGAAGGFATDENAAAGAGGCISSNHRSAPDARFSPYGKPCGGAGQFQQGRPPLQSIQATSMSPSAQQQQQNQQRAVHPSAGQQTGSPHSMAMPGAGGASRDQGLVPTGPGSSSSGREFGMHAPIDHQQQQQQQQQQRGVTGGVGQHIGMAGGGSICGGSSGGGGGGGWGVSAGGSSVHQAGGASSDQGCYIPQQGPGSAVVQHSGGAAASATDQADQAMKYAYLPSYVSTKGFMDYQNFIRTILDKNDYERVGGKFFVKKGGWRKIAFAFQVSFEYISGDIEYDQGQVSRGEKTFSKPNHDIPATAETRAKNRACSDLFGIKGKD